ncbi:MAG: RNA methyltransferase [Deltaproteobacteria bacterium]|nr:RNA methyltransferase [Deltaproteobacteria bacterium]
MRASRAARERAGKGEAGRIEGARPIIEAIRAGRRQVLEVRLPHKPTTPAQRELEALVEERSIPRRPLERGASGAVARAEPYLEEPFEELLLGTPPHFLVALDRVTDVGNLGSIARSAEVAGAGGLVLEYRHAPPIGPGALRASAGALEHLRVGRTPSLPRALETAAAEGLTVLAAEAGGEPLADLPRDLLQGGLVWVFGSEDRGLRGSVARRADRTVGIPRQGRVESLGVAAAAAYLLQRTAELRRNPPSETLA